MEQADSQKVFTWSPVFRGNRLLEMDLVAQTLERKPAKATS